jgi:hypothetical protein
MGIVTIFAEAYPTFTLTEMLSDILKDLLAAVVSQDQKNRINNLYHDWQKLRHSLLAP